jgi:HPt (histidine-containing phosphotransfer) domain-containing protein
MLGLRQLGELAAQLDDLLRQDGHDEMLAQALLGEASKHLNQLAALLGCADAATPSDLNA